MKITAGVADAMSIGITPEQAVDWEGLRDTLDTRTAGELTCLQLDKLVDMVSRRVVRPWRKPDMVTPAGRCVWYGPAGAEGDCATEVEHHADGWLVRQYQHVKGYLDQYDPTRPYLVTEVYVSRERTNRPRLAAAVGVAFVASVGGSEWFAGALPR